MQRYDSNELRVLRNAIWASIEADCAELGFVDLTSPEAQEERNQLKRDAEKVYEDAQAFADYKCSIHDPNNYTMMSHERFVQEADADASIRLRIVTIKSRIDFLVQRVVDAGGQRILTHIAPHWKGCDKNFARRMIREQTTMPISL
jgi:hypothetical protein